MSLTVEGLDELRMLAGIRGPTPHFAGGGYWRPPRRNEHSCRTPGPIRRLFHHVRVGDRWECTCAQWWEWQCPGDAQWYEWVRMDRWTP